MELLEKISVFLNRSLSWIGGVFLVGMIVLTCGNIVFRLVWVPIRGTFELMGYFGAIVTAFALGYTQMKRGHISVDVLVNTFSDKRRKVVDTINYTVCFLFFGVAAWQIAVKATTLMNTGEITETLRIIYYPFTYGVALGCAVLSLVLFTDLIKSFIPKKEGND
ncbi:MAG: TRAP transporter small permease [Desulfobacteraceae bacterium]|jgi:TRAP-type C4-dicarboxylate transport system permease small subunit|nr:TRAP transporter small permease [Desulfobacteraceae bacterium]